MQTRLFEGGLYGLAAGALWGIIFLPPLLLPAFPPLYLAAGRYLIYGLISCIMMLCCYRHVLRRVTRAELRTLFYISAFGSFVYYYCLAEAIRSAGVVFTSLIIGLSPVIPTLFDTQQRPYSKVTLFAPLTLILLGIVCMQGPALLSGYLAPSDAYGIVYAFGALAAWCLSSICNTRFLRTTSRYTSHEWSLLTGVATGGVALLILPLLLLAPLPIQVLHTEDWLRFTAVAVIVAIVASILGNGLWNAASRRLPLSLGGQLIVFETVFAVLYGLLYMARWPRAEEVLAIVLILSGVLWSMHAHRPVYRQAEAIA